MGEEYVIAELKFCILSTPLVSAVNHMTTRTFREKKNNNNDNKKKKKKESFLSTKFKCLH